MGQYIWSVMFPQTPIQKTRKPFCSLGHISDTDISDHKHQQTSFSIAHEYYYIKLFRIRSHKIMEEEKEKVETDTQPWRECIWAAKTKLKIIE